MKGQDHRYERPLIEPDNMLTGGFQTGRYDASPREATGRSAARWSLVFAVLWLGGLASLPAIAMGGLALASGDIGTRSRRLAAAGTVLGVLGLVAGLALAFTL
jgi:hypothetical protein